MRGAVVGSGFWPLMLAVAFSVGCSAKPPAVSLASANAPRAPEAGSVARQGAAVRREDGAAARAERVPRRVVPRMVWRFQAGAPIAAPPAVGSDGSVYVGTTEGMVHALGPDGGFRWSYGVQAPVMGSAAVGSGGVIYVGTTQGHVYALLPSGKKLWGYSANAPIVTDLVVSQGGIVHFGDRNRQLHAISPRGGGLWRVALKGFISSGPTLGPRGEVVVGTDVGGLVRVDRLQRKRRTQLGGAITAHAVGPDGSVYAVVDEQLAAVAPDGSLRWRVSGVRAVVLAADSLLTTRQHGGLGWWSRDGALQRSVRLDVGFSAAPAVDPSGCVYVPTEAGDLVVVRGDRVSYRVPVARSALGRPQVDPARGHVVVASGSGVVAAVAIGCGPRD